MKKLFEYAVYASSIISWLSLLIFFFIDDTKSEIGYEKLIIFVAGVIIFWALSQLALAYVLGNKNNRPKDKGQSDERQAELDARKREQENMEQVYHLALICKTDKLIELTKK